MQGAGWGPAGDGRSPSHRGAVPCGPHKQALSYIILYRLQKCSTHFALFAAAQQTVEGKQQKDSQIH